MRFIFKLFVCFLVALIIHMGLRNYKLSRELHDIIKINNPDKSEEWIKGQMRMF